MATRKWKFTLAETPSEIHRDDLGDTVLKLRVPTKLGRRVLVLRDQEVIKTVDDPVADNALENYRPPKIPMQHKPGGVPSNAYHNYLDHAAKRPFTEIVNTSPFDHDLSVL